MDSVTNPTTQHVHDLVWSERVPVDGVVEIMRSRNDVLSVWYYEDRQNYDGVCIGRYLNFDEALERAVLFIAEEVMAPLHMAQYY